MRQVLEPTSAQTKAGKPFAAAPYADRRADRLGQDARRIPDRASTSSCAEGLHEARCPTKCASSTSRRSRRCRTTSRGTSRRRSPSIRARCAERDGHSRRRRSASPCAPATRRQRARGDVRKPPHILVTTPESLYILLTARARPRDAETRAHGDRRRDPRGRGDKRGAHLALSLERLDALCGRGRPVRIGLSATQRPIEEVARLLVGATIADDCRARSSTRATPRRSISRIEIPDDALDAVMSHEVWAEVYDRIAELVDAHRTTLVFVNTRRLAERVGAPARQRLGEEHVAAHHGSLSQRAAARRRAAAQAASSRRGRDGVARARHRRRRTSISSSSSARRDRSRRCSSASAAPGHPSADAEGPAVPAHARRARRVRGAARAPCGAASSTRSRSATRRSTSWRSRSSRDRRARGVRRGRAVRARARRVAVPRPRRATSSSRSCRCSATAIATRRGRRGGATCIATQSTAACAARRGARLTAITSRRRDSRQTPTTASCSSPKETRRHARRGLRDRERCRRHLPARQHVVADPPRRAGRRARRRCARRSRRRSRSGSAKRRPAARAVRCRVATARGARCATPGPDEPRNAAISSRDRWLMRRVRTAARAAPSRSSSTSPKDKRALGACRRRT